MAISYTTPALSGVGTYSYDAYDVWDDDAPTVGGGSLSAGQSCLDNLPTRLSGASTDLDVTGRLDVNDCAKNEGIENDINTAACDVSGRCGTITNGCSFEAGCEVLLVEFIGENMDAGSYDFNFELLGPGDSSPRFEITTTVNVPSDGGFAAAFSFVGMDPSEVWEEGQYTYQCKVSRDSNPLGTPKVDIDVVRTPDTNWYGMI